MMMIDQDKGEGVKNLHSQQQPIYEEIPISPHSEKGKILSRDPSEWKCMTTCCTPVANILDKCYRKFLFRCLFIVFSPFTSCYKKYKNWVRKNLILSTKMFLTIEGILEISDRYSDPVSYTHLTLPTIYSV
eukprot:TRINITY_DN7259_c0_g1_i2.p1 TRINITY_DN7259_c0_g1~~TRINITY_DN7259_c0_g1_i2.p1  ORF type:complete len:131 (+),score=5.23 TRINITY_DN7259_c0_g1_i2:48-440(+)